MKRTKFMFVGVASLSLSLACGALLANHNNVKAVHAADPVFMIGEHNLLTNATCSSYTGTATLVTTASEYTLTLNGFSNYKSGSYYSYVSGGNSSAALTMLNLDRPVTIKLIGNNTLNNTSSSYTYVYGIYASGAAISVVGQSNNPTLTCTAPNNTGMSAGLRSSGAGSYAISNCTTTFNGGNSIYSYGYIAPSAVLTISDSTVNVNSGTSSAAIDDVETIALDVRTYTQNSGTVTLKAGNTSGLAYSRGLYTTTGVTINDGNLDTRTGTTVGRATSGIYVENGDVTVNGGSVYAEAKDCGSEEGQKSWGVYCNSVTGTSDQRLIIKDSVASFYAKGIERGTNYKIKPSFLGYASNTGNIYTDANPSTIASGSEDFRLFKEILFRRIQYNVSSTSSLTYDGDGHNALTIAVSVPASDYTIRYSSDGGTSWSTTNPTFTDASSYVVQYEITSKLYAPATGSSSLTINKADSSLTATPTKVDDFVYDGDVHELINAGVASGGTLMYSVDGGEYATSLPSKINAGSYEVSYKVVGDDNHNNIDPVSLGTIVISKANAAVVNAPVKVADFTADGQAHNLLTAGSATGGTLMYSVNGGAYSESIPSATDAGSYELSYKVVGDNNHNDSAPVSLGSVVIAEAPAPEPTPTPEPTPSDPESGLPVGAVVGIVIGSIILALGLAYLVLFFLLNKWINVGGKAVRVMRFALGSKDGRGRYISFKCRFEYRDKEEVFNSKQDALK